MGTRNFGTLIHVPAACVMKGWHCVRHSVVLPHYAAILLGTQVNAALVVQVISSINIIAVKYEDEHLSLTYQT